METLSLFGVGCAFMASLGWAFSTIILKFLTARIDTLSLNTFRLWVGSVVLLAVVLSTGRSAQMISAPMTPLLLVIASGVVAVAVGDTIYIKSLSLVDASKAFTVGQCAFPLLTALVAVLFLGEAFTWRIAAGAVMVTGGIYFVSGRGANAAARPGSAKMHTLGILLALAAALAWTFAAVTLKIGAARMDSFVAAATRIPAAAIALTLFVMGRGAHRNLNLLRHGWQSAALAAGAGVLTYGVSAVAYVYAIQSIGAARTVLITTTAPVMVLPLSILLLKERPSASSFAGIASCILGIACIAA